MMKALMIFAACAFTVSAQAAPDVFAQYSTLGTQIKKDIMAKAPVAQLNKNMLELATLGYAMMDMYAAKFPECQAQFAEVKAKDADMQTATLQVLEDVYHDGNGIAKAPQHCYLGRSMVVHPYIAMAIVRVGGTGADGEIDEVVVRVPKIKTKLGL